MAQEPATASGGGTVPVEMVTELIHDLNGHLMPIVGFSELLAAGTLPDTMQPKAMRAIGAAATALAERLRLATADLRSRA